ncbi:MAG: YbfB/YjiJ family MFS transporter [Acetobacteraceae bacterium]
MRLRDATVAGDRPGIWSALAGMLAVASSLGIGRFVYTPILPAMAEALGLSGRQAGLIASANFAGYLLGAVVAMSPRLPGGARRWFVGGLLVGAATIVGMAGASGLWAFMGLRFLGGASSAFVLVLGTASVLDSLGRAGLGRHRWIHYAGVGLGIAVSAVVVAVAEAWGASWRVLWLAPGLVAALMAPVPAVQLRWRGAPARGGTARGRLGPGLVGLAVCHGLFGFGYVVTATFLVAIVRGSASGRVLEPVVWVIVGVAAIPSSLLWDRLGSRFGARRAYSLACVIEGVGVLAGGAWPTAAGAIIAASLLGATFMGLTALGFSAARELGEAGQARRFAVVKTAVGIG